MSNFMHRGLLPLPWELKNLGRRSFLSNIKQNKHQAHLSRNVPSVVRAASNMFPSSERLLEPGAIFDEIENIKLRIRSIEEKRDNGLYLEIARVFDLSEFLSENESAWIEYCRDEKWAGVDARSRPKSDQMGDALRAVVFDLCLDIEDPGRRKKRLNLYFSALRELKSRNVAARDAYEVIRRTPNGLSGLRAAWVSRMRKEEREKGFQGAIKESRPISPPRLLSKKVDKNETISSSGGSVKVSRNTEKSARYIHITVRNNKCFKALMQKDLSVVQVVNFKRL